MTDIQYTTLLNEISKLNDKYDEFTDKLNEILLYSKHIFKDYSHITQKSQEPVTKSLLERCPLDSDLDKLEIEEAKKAKEELSNILSSKVIDENALSKFNCTVPEL